jgi:tetratricopeptide (TPR) repeat protein
MHRYRVNYRLLIGLLIGSFVAAGASYGMWRFQIDRNATRLLAKADEAEKEKDVEETYKNLAQFLKLRPSDNEARVRLGKAALEYIKLEGGEDEKKREAYQALVSAVISTDDAELRRELADLQVQSGAFDFALQNIDELLNDGQGDPDLKVMKAQCLFQTKKEPQGAAWCYRLIGYDSRAKTFDPAKAEAPRKPLPYAMLAQYMYANDREAEAQSVLDQMIAENPESREAHMLHYQFLKTRGEEEAAQAALDKAYELDPTDLMVLNFKGSEEMAAFQAETAAATGVDAEAQREAAKKHLDLAAKLFEDGLERYPNSIGLYKQAARVELLRDETEEALAIVDRGVKKFPLRERTDGRDIPVALDLVSLKLDVLLANKEFDAAKKVLQELRDLNNAQVALVADYYDARIDAINERWREAADKLDAIKPRLVYSTEMQAMAAAIQGFCHNQLGEFDLALDAYEWALKKNPNLSLAQAGRNELLARRPGAEQPETSQLDQLVRTQLELPRDQQNWIEIEAASDKMIEDQAAGRQLSKEWIDSRKRMMHARLYAVRSAAAEDPAAKASLLAQAIEAINDAYEIDPADGAIQEQIVRIVSQDPDGGPAKALERLDKIVAEHKDTVNLRVLRAELVLAIGGEELPDKLNQVTEGMADWDENQQAAVWKAVGGMFERAGNFPEAQRCLQRAIELAPTNLPYRLALFELALKQADDVAMRQAQEKILEIVKERDDETYVLSEVKRRIVGFERGFVTLAELQEARKILNKAIRNRPSFADLHIASGQLWLTLEKNPDRALAAFDEALKYGPANLNAVNLQVRLLADQGRFQEAREKMKSIPQQAWAQLLDRTAATVLLNVGETELAFAEAEKLAQSRPNDDATLVWFAQIADQAEKYDKVEEALKKAIEINPGNPDHWTSLVGVYLQLKRSEDVESTLRQAHLELDAEYLPLLAAKYYELQSRWQEAEDIYLSAYEGRLDEPAVARRMAEFYLLWSSKYAANRGKAYRYINRILKSVYEGKTPADDVQAQWARQQAARLLSLNNTYRDSLKAEQLLVDDSGKVTPGDRDVLIEVLSRRGDPASRERVVSLLRDIQKERTLEPARELQLGVALNELGRWDECRLQMDQAIARHPQDLGLQTAYASMLITRKEFGPAQRWINQIKTLPNTARPVTELEIRLANAQGQKDKVRASLEQITPDLRVLNAEQLETVLSVAQLAESFGDYEYALKLIREYDRRQPGRELELARLVAQYGPLDEAITLLTQALNRDMDAAAGLAVDMLRRRRAEDPEKLDAAVGRIIAAARRDDPESARRMISEAEMLEVQGRYEDSIAAYEKLLARDDVPELMRAAASNNLAYLLGSTGAKLDAALAAANEAIDVLGPISDVLDTRALVYTARGDYAQAIEDMQLAVKVGATASKYYHLAAALLAGGDEMGALEAWKKVDESKLTSEGVSESERAKFAEVKAKIDALRGGSPQL